MYAISFILASLSLRPSCADTVPFMRVFPPMLYSSLSYHDCLQCIAWLQAALVLLLDGLWFGYDQLQFFLRK